MAAPYYPEDDYYDRPSRSRRRDYDDGYREPRGSDRGRAARAPPPRQTSSSGGSGKVAAVVILILILIILYMFRVPLMAFLQDLNDNPPSLRYMEFPEGVEFTVEKEMVLGSSGSGSIDYKIKSACPKDHNIGNFELQDVRSVNVNPTPSTGEPNLSDPHQEIMLWQEDNFNDEITIVARYSITTRFFEWELEDADSGVVSDIPAGLKTKYNHDEWEVGSDYDYRTDANYLIEPSNPRIKSLADQLASGETNVYKIVRNIYDYLIRSDKLNYVPSSTGMPKDCITMLNNYQGDCDDYSILFISLCRALDIPAWLQLGVLYDKQQQHWGGHAWSKVAIPLTSGSYTTPSIDIVNKQFFFHDPYRFIEWTDTGGDELYPGETEPRNNLDYYYHTFSYQSTGSPNIEPPDTNNFRTIDINEFGDKKRIPVEDEGSGLGEICMLPGFEAFDAIASIFTVTFILLILTRSYRKKKL